MNIKAVLKGTIEQLKVIYEVIANPDMYEGVVKITSKEMIRMISVTYFYKCIYLVPVILFYQCFSWFWLGLILFLFHRMTQHSQLDNPDMYEGVVKITSKEMIRMVSVNLEEAYKQIEIEEQENE
jgi:DNA polymerase III psi subunit